jgi:hypothetical protein
MSISTALRVCVRLGLEERPMARAKKIGFTGGVLSDERDDGEGVETSRLRAGTVLAGVRAVSRSFAGDL